MSNAPTYLLNDRPLARAIVVSAADATATTVTNDDSGTIFISKATNAHTYTLPTTSEGKGKFFIFVKAYDANMVISSAGSADDIIAEGDTGADTVTYSTSSHKIGSACLVFGDGTNWFSINIGGTTATVA